LTTPGKAPLQILHPFAGSIQQYSDSLADPDRYRPRDCPQCRAKQPLISHGFYRRTLVDPTFDGFIRVRRYLCQLCKRTVSLLPEFALPWLRFSLTVLSVFLTARLLLGLSLAAAIARTALPMPYQRCQFWIRRFLRQAPALGLSLTPLTPPVTATDPLRALRMLQSTGWIAAHRFLFSKLRAHLLGWPPSLAPQGLAAALLPRQRPA
jgi:transposase-like protein